MISPQFEFTAFDEAMWRYNPIAAVPERVLNDDEAERLSATREPSHFDTTDFSKFLQAGYPTHLSPVLQTSNAIYMSSTLYTNSQKLAWQADRGSIAILPCPNMRINAYVRYWDQ